MSYLSFLLLFVVPPIALLAWTERREIARLHPRAALFLAALAAIALVYTTPWDNYLVWRGVWSYGPDRVLGAIGYVPVEEYLFFLLQPLLAGLWLYRVLRTSPAPLRPLRSPALARWAGALAYLAATLAGVLLLRREEGTYLGLILVWAGPVLALQWGYAGGGIWARRRAWLVGTAVPTLYLWAADAIAIRVGIWRISEAHTLGVGVGSLPLEEAVFFLVTNLLVVQGLLLFLHPPGHATAPARPAPAVAR